jgi:hypothetical protein
VIDAIFEPGHPGLDRTKPVVQAGLERDHSAAQPGNVVLHTSSRRPIKSEGVSLMSHIPRLAGSESLTGEVAPLEMGNL